MQFCLGSQQLRGVAICVLGFFEPACALDVDEDTVRVSERVEGAIVKFRGGVVKVLRACLFVQKMPWSSDAAKSA